MRNGRYFAMVPRDQIVRLPLSIAAKVYLVIKSYPGAFDRGVVGNLSLSQIARLVGTGRHNVPRAIRRLEADGFLSTVHGGPRGHTKNLYMLPAEDDDGETTVAEKSGITPDTRSGLTVETGSALTVETRSGLTPENPLERVERKEILGEGAPSALPRPTKKAVSSREPVRSRQGALLLPIKGGARPAYDIAAYQPPRELEEWAWRKYGVDANDELAARQLSRPPAAGRSLAAARPRQGLPELDPPRGEIRRRRPAPPGAAFEARLDFGRRQ